MGNDVKAFFDSIAEHHTEGHEYSFAEGARTRLRTNGPGDAVYLQFIGVERPYRASQTLYALCDAADEHGVDLQVSDEGDGLDYDTLCDWYWRAGFRGQPDEMVREPQHGG